MPYYDPPNSDLKRLAMMRQASNRIAQEGADSPIPAPMASELNEVLGQFEGALARVRATTQARHEEVQEADEALAKLKIYVRHGWTAIKNRILREELSASLHAYYGLTLAGDLPKPTSRQEWLTMARDIVRGDAHAVQKGYEPLSNPTAVQINAILTQAEQEANEVLAARASVSKAQKEVQTLRTAVDHILKEIVAALNYHYRHLQAPSIRNKVRFHGGTFRPYAGEPTEEDEVEE